jgi:acyl transferase domain-containing protein
MRTVVCGLLEAVDRFDAQFRHFSARSRRWIAAEIHAGWAWEAIEDARYSSSQSKGCRSGVFCGAMGAIFETVGARIDVTQHCHRTGPEHHPGSNLLCVRPRRPEHDGQHRVSSRWSPCTLPVRHCTGEVEPLAGGVNLIVAPDSTVRCASSARWPRMAVESVHARANGKKGAKAGLVVLKLCPRPFRRRSIYCVLLGSAINNDGRSNI